MKLLLDDRNEDVSCHGAPDLRLHGVLAVANEMLDSQVLLDPFEEQLHLPSTLGMQALLADSRLLERFRAKGRFEHYLAEVPVHLIVSSRSPALRGMAAHLA